MERPVQTLPRYTRTAMSLHWLTALLIISAFIMGLVMTSQVVIHHAPVQTGLRWPD